MNLIIRVVVLFVYVSLISSLEILNSHLLNCTQEGLTCDAKITNCLDKDWFRKRDYTPNGPGQLKADVDVREDENGDLVPVIVARWTARDDASIHAMKGTELQVLMISTNHHLCVQYIFSNKIPMRTIDDELWTFILDQVVVDPEQSYLVSVYNLPKPNLKHTGYNINKTITVPGCKDHNMKKTKVCLQSGSLWEPNLTMEKSTGPHGGPVISVRFNSGEHSELYKVSVQCDNDRHTETLRKNNRTSFNVTYDLEKWPLTCCNFDVQIEPFFTQCFNDCIRKQRSFNICPGPSPYEADPKICTVVAVGVLFLISAIGLCAVNLRHRKQQRGPPDLQNSSPDSETKTEPLPSVTRRVLLIYSKDHPLYMKIVLKLCAFLRAKCSTEVGLDLLDSAWVGAVGRLPWLEQQIRSSDKILVLCSRGVRAKWGAICGESPVTLREDVRSPTDDTLIPALNLILPDVQRAASFGKYMVAYFEDVSSERDVPSMFDIAVKYKLMKHFEELYFRILDMEKYQPGKVSSIEGIGTDEYFNCPTGRDLRDTIETFQAYQFENPDWFEKQCVDSEEEVKAEYDPLLDQNVYPVLQCAPVYNEGPPIFVHEVDIHREGQGPSVYAVTPNTNQGGVGPSVLEFDPKVQPGHYQAYSSHPAVEPPPGVLAADIRPLALEDQMCLLADPALQEPSGLSRNVLCVQGESATESCPIEHQEVQPCTSFRKPSPEALQQLLALQLSLTPMEITKPTEFMEDKCPHPRQEMNRLSQPLEMEEDQLEEPSGKRQSSGSDQGYSSRDSPVVADPLGSSLIALAKLQEDLYLDSTRSSGFCTETTGSGEDLEYDQPNTGPL